MNDGFKEMTDLVKNTNDILELGVLEKKKRIRRYRRAIKTIR